MPQLFRRDLEGIACRVFTAYKRLSEVSNEETNCIDPELLTRRLLGLALDYCHLSKDGSVLGLTSFAEIGVEIFDTPDTQTFYYLDGKTVLIETDLASDATQLGRYNFTVAHEVSHQILAMLFPSEYKHNDDLQRILPCA